MICVQNSLSIEKCEKNKPSKSQPGEYLVYFLLVFLVLRFVVFGTLGISNFISCFEKSNLTSEHKHFQVIIVFYTFLNSYPAYHMGEGIFFNTSQAFISVVGFLESSEHWSELENPGLFQSRIWAGGRAKGLEHSYPNVSLQRERALVPPQGLFCYILTSTVLI